MFRHGYRKVYILFYLALAGFGGRAAAEPWISNRFAQNCAGCHAPGRKNLAPADRRCTLACQGCHVSPNGSGMRSHYGKWNENRWLKSFRTDIFAHDRMVAPTKQQRYGYGKKWKKVPVKKIREGFGLKEISSSYVNESIYDRRDGLEKVMSKNRDEFEHQVPIRDPYRQMREQKIDGGGDIRWQFQQLNTKRSTEGVQQDGKAWFNFLMTGDLALRWRPIYKKVHFVYEGRHQGNPFDKHKTPDKPLNSFYKRSMYAMVDDLPYNLYVMGGYYRPLFGNMDPDHTLLTNRMVSFALQDNGASYNLHYQAFSVGGSPNVPYANLHLVQRQFGAAPNDSHQGFAANIGGRFVSFGFSGAYSFWNTEKVVSKETGDVKVKVQMHAFGFGGQVGPVTVNLDAYSITKDVENDAFREGGVIALDTYTRIWRENYVNIGYYTANVAETLEPGAGSQVRFGIRSFLYPGVDVSLGIRQESQTTDKVNDKTTSSETNIGAITGQIHLYL